MALIHLHALNTDSASWISKRHFVSIITPFKALNPDPPTGRELHKAALKMGWRSVKKAERHKLKDDLVFKHTVRPIWPSNLLEAAHEW